jgi:hypothetical protein
MVTLSASSHDINPGDPGIAREPLRCGDTNAAVPGARHPFVAFKETNPASGAWRLLIQSRDTTAAVLYPNAIRLQARAIAAQGKSSFTWSNTAASNGERAQKLNFLVHVNNGEPAAIEVFPATANWHAAPSPEPVKFCWPSD